MKNVVSFFCGQAIKALFKLNAVVKLNDDILESQRAFPSFTCTHPFPLRTKSNVGKPRLSEMFYSIYALPVYNSLKKNLKKLKMKFLGYTSFFSLD